MTSLHAAPGDEKDHGKQPAGTQAPKKQSLLGGTIAEKFGGSTKDILEEE